MKTFDYASAFDALIVPAWAIVPDSVKALVERTAAESADLGQLADCSMPWPTDSDLPEAFKAIPTHELAFAARVVYFIGHWNHKRSTLRPDWTRTGASWKFSHYADQVLRERHGLPARGDNGRAKGWHLQILEGAIRLCYASDDMWIWEEIAPATDRGMIHARVLQFEGSQALGGLTNTRRERKRDDAAYAFMEGVKNGRGFWPEAWVGFGDTSAFMIEEDVMKAREAARPDVRQQRLQQLAASRDKTIADTTRNEHAEYERKAWLVERGIDLDNVIYYAHRDVVCFGWLRPVSHEQTSVLRDLLCEYPYAYEIKSATLGVIGTRA